MRVPVLTPDTQHPTRALPHAYPFILLDRCVGCEPGRWAVAVKNLTAGDPLLDGHGTLPPLLLAEMMAQAAGLAAVDITAPRRVAVVANLDRFRCRGGVGR